MANKKYSKLTPFLMHTVGLGLSHIIVLSDNTCFLFGNLLDGFDHCVLKCRLDKLNQLLFEMGNSGAWISEAICKNEHRAKKYEFHINVKASTGQEMQYITNVGFDLIKTGEIQMDDDIILSCFIKDVHGKA